MIKFSTIGQIEKLYVFEDAVLTTDAYNGDFVAVTDGDATPSANSLKAIMQIEVGDDANLDVYPIKAGNHVRVVDLAAIAKKYPIKTVEVYGKQVPIDVAVGDKLVSDDTGVLVAGASTVPYLEVTEIIGNNLGVEVSIVTADEASDETSNNGD